MTVGNCLVCAKVDPSSTKPCSKPSLVSCGNADACDVNGTKSRDIAVDIKCKVPVVPSEVSCSRTG